MTGHCQFKLLDQRKKEEGLQVEEIGEEVVVGAVVGVVA